MPTDARKAGRGSLKRPLRSNKDLSEELFQDRARRKQMWKQKFENSGSDDCFSSEEGDSDMPHVYKPPLDLHPQDIPNPQLPEWLDPIYDEMEPKDYHEAERAAHAEGRADGEHSSDVLDIEELNVDPETSTVHLKRRRMPGIVEDFDEEKEFTFSEIEELVRIWDLRAQWAQICGTATDPAPPAIAPPPQAALPWEGDAGETSPEMIEGPWLPLLADDTPLLEAAAGEAQSTVVDENDSTPLLPAPDPAAAVHVGGQVGAEAADGLVATTQQAAVATDDCQQRAQAAEGGAAGVPPVEPPSRWRQHAVDSTGDVWPACAASPAESAAAALNSSSLPPPHLPVDQVAAGPAGAAPTADLDAYIPPWAAAGEELTAAEAAAQRLDWVCLEDEKWTPRPPSRRAGAKGPGDGVLVESRRPRRAPGEGPRPTGIDWCVGEEDKLEAGAYVGGTNPFDYSLNLTDISVGVPDFTGPAWDPPVAPELTQFQEWLTARWGFLPMPGDRIPGFNTWNTSAPPPLLPPPTPRRGDLVVPDDCETVPRAVFDAEDGGRVYLRAGNHTWTGLAPEYDGLSMARPRPAADEEALLSTLLVPAGTAVAPTADPEEREAPLEDAAAGFCLHLAGDRGARACGRWLLRAGSVGSLSGVEAVWEANSSWVSLPCQLLLSTLEVRGAPWLLDRCAVRACGGVALECTRRALVKVRECVVGGISDDIDRHALSGRATMALQARDFARCVVVGSTLERSGWNRMGSPAARFTGCTQGTLDRCLLHRNIHSLGIVDRARVTVTRSTMRQNEQGALHAAEAARGPVTPEASDEGPRGQDEVWRAGDAKRGRQARWDETAGAWIVDKGEETLRWDSVRGQTVDNWVLGAPGWSCGVPLDFAQAMETLLAGRAGVNLANEDPSAAEAAAARRRWPGSVLPVSGLATEFMPGQPIDGTVGGAALAEVAEAVRSWARVGCARSQRVADGLEEGDRLAPGFDAGAAAATLEVRDSEIYGVVWSTAARPGRWALRNVTNPRDEWVEKFLGPEEERFTVRDKLEAIGLRWDRVRRTYLKPARTADGVVHWVDWNETRFAAHGATGGYPGTTEDYPMFDRAAGRRITVLNVSEAGVGGGLKCRVFPLLEHVEPLVPEELQEEVDDLVDRAARYERWKERWDRFHERAHRQYENAMASAGGDPELERDAAAGRLLHKFMTRSNREDPLWEQDNKCIDILDFQPL